MLREIDISQGNSMLYSGISNYFAIITDKLERNTQMSYVEFKNVSKTYKTGDVSVEALKDASFEIGKGEICVIVGQSGAGKTTLLNILGGMDRLTEGEVYLDGTAVSDYNKKQLATYRRRDIGFVFQFYNLIPNLTVKENIEVGAYLGSNPLDVDDLLHTLGLWEHKDKIPSQLSGGQQQRTSIGRAIVKNPDLLLCDEPTGALDYNTSKDILKLIEDVNRKYGNTIIIVTHNDAIKLMADRVIKLRDGMIRKEYTNETKTPAMELDW